MKSWMCCLSIILLLTGAAAPAHAARVWTASDATVTLTLPDETLSSFGLRVADSRTTGEAPITGLEGRRHAFVASDASGLRFRSKNGAFDGFVGGRATLSFRGGLAFGAEHPVRGDALSPAFLYDFVVEIDPSLGPDQVVLRPATSSVSPLQVRNVGFLLDEEHGLLSMLMGDIQVTPEWAAELGQPAMAGQWIGGFDLRMHAATASPKEEPVREEEGTEPSVTLDVTLAQLYGITSQGHIGTYPNGRAGLSAATTSCNTGTVNVPWNSPMAETHPFIALALFREMNGTLEQIGKNWIKHGFFALSNDQCNLGCPGGGNGSQLLVDCSDTYSAGNNGSRFYLGPREEVDPFTSTWVACGSFFDEPVVPDGDCARDYNGSEPDGVAHRLEVEDADLDLPGATYYYEGEYFVANDTKLVNNIGWRECTMSWAGSNWNFSTVGGGLTPNYGLVVETWGDASKRANVGVDDGEVVLASKVTDLGGGMWHYEYALYNWRSARGAHSIAIPVGSANVSNIGYHDIDQDGGNDWTATLAGGVLTWATDDYATDPNANALDYQTMFNFRFDCDVAPVASEATGLAFRPGVGTSFTIVTDAPSAPMSTTDAPNVAGSPDRDLFLAAAEPNPFSHNTRLSFSLPRPQAARVTVHDIAGRTIRVLFDDVAPAGESSVRWDGRDTDGSEVASGVYFFRLTSPDGARATKATLRR